MTLPVQTPTLASMKNKTRCNVTYPFVAKHSADVIGVLSGFDRLRLRGTLRALYQPTVLLRYLFVCQVLLNVTGRNETGH